MTDLKAEDYPVGTDMIRAARMDAGDNSFGLTTADESHRKMVIGIIMAVFKAKAAMHK